MGKVICDRVTAGKRNSTMPAVEWTLPGLSLAPSPSPSVVKQKSGCMHACQNDRFRARPLAYRVTGPRRISIDDQPPLALPSPQGGSVDRVSLASKAVNQLHGPGRRSSAWKAGTGRPQPDDL